MAGNNAGNNAGQPSTQRRTLLTHMLQDPWTSIQFAMRSGALFCSLGYFMFGLSGSIASAYRLYLNVMLTSFIASAIKLHLRMKEAQVQLLSRNALQFFPTEDSAHYLIYTLLFYNQPPTTIFVIPMFLYALLFTVRYIQGIAQFLPQFIERYISVLLRSVATKQASIHRFIGFCEVFSMIVLAWKAITGHAFLLAPFLYYQFLKLRYTSRRNPSVRTVFSELRVAADHGSTHPYCPALLANVIRKVVYYICKLDPYQQASAAGTGAT